MSKLLIALSYKNACILKHALRDKVEELNCLLNPGELMLDFEFTVEETKKMRKELEEKERALQAFTEQMEDETKKMGIRRTSN